MQGLVCVYVGGAANFLNHLWSDGSSTSLYNVWSNTVVNEDINVVAG